MVEDRDIVAYTVIRMLLFSAAFQHASALSCEDKVQRKISRVAHQEMMGVLAALVAEMRRIKEIYKKENKISDIHVGEILYFQKEYFCNYILTEEKFPSDRSNILDLSTLIENLYVSEFKNAKSIIKNNEHYLILSGKLDYRNGFNQKPFWVFNVNVEQMSLCCAEYAKQIFL